MRKALEQLEFIVNVDGVDTRSGKEARNKLLTQWIADHITEIEYSQPVMKRNLSTEDEDFIKYYLAYKLGDKLMDDCIHLDNSNKNVIKTKVYALKR